MLKVFNVISILLFVLVASAAPYVSAKGAALAFAQNPEERTAQGANNLEEEIHHTTAHSIYIVSVEVIVTYPQVIQLKPQQVLYDVLKPPSRSIS